MAGHKIIFKTSVEFQFNNGRYNQGTSIGDYPDFQLDSHADRRSWGGIITRDDDDNGDSEAYEVNYIKSYTNGVLKDLGGQGVDVTANYLDMTNGVTKGANIPATVYFLAIERVSDIGTVDTVTVVLSPTKVMRLKPGEGSVLHIHDGKSSGVVDIYASAWEAGVHEATVNIIIAGAE